MQLIYSVNKIYKHVTLIIKIASNHLRTEMIGNGSLYV